MGIIDVGSGPPLVLIPGIQGRWEWMSDTVAALAQERRVISSSLPGEPGAPLPWERSRGFDVFVDYVDALLDARQIASAVMCGVSFGGLIALRYAARRPARVDGLILVSTPGPRWTPVPRQQRQIDWPRLSSPIFVAGALRRGWRELRVTYPSLPARLMFSARAGARVLRAPAVPRRMAERARLAIAEQFEPDCASVVARTLVVTGERDLDAVVRPDDSLRYVTAITGAQYHLLERTGHLGTISAPHRFAAIVSRFLYG